VDSSQLAVPTDTARSTGGSEPGAALGERPWWHALGVFDLETTGIDVETARIVSAHVGLIDVTGASVAAGSWLADPGVPIPEQAAAVHGITTERARAEGRPAGVVVAEIIAAVEAVFARGIPLVVYNAPYDLTILDREAKRHGLPSPVVGNIVDPLVIDKAVDTFRRGKRTLEACAAIYGVTLSDAHDAGADAVAAGRVAQSIAERYPDRLAITSEELHRLQVAWCSDQAASFQEYMRRERNPQFVADGRWPHRTTD
jgi:DNA polymerase-3 subunit epsilon